MNDTDEKVNQTARWVKSRPVRALLWAAGAVALYAALGFFAVPPIARHYLAKTLTEQLDRASTVERIEFNPFVLRARVFGLRVQERGEPGEALALDQLLLDVNGAALLRAALEVEALRLDGVRLRFARLPDGSFSFSDLIRKFGAEPAAPAADSEPTRFTLRQIELTGGDIEFDDRLVGQKHRLAGLRLGVPLVSNRPDNAETPVEPRVEATANDAPLALSLSVKPFTATQPGSVTVSLKGLALPRYLAYAPPDLKLKVPSGTLDAEITGRFSRKGDAGPAIVLGGTLRVRELAITEPDGSLVASAPRLAVKATEIDLPGRKAAIESVTLEDGDFRLVRGTNNVLTVLQYVPRAGEGAEDEQPFAVKVGEIRVMPARFNIRDDAVQPPFEMRYERVDLTIRNLGNRPEDVAEVEMVTAGGTFDTAALKGTLALAPVRLDVHVNVNGARIPEFAPYYQGSLAFAVEQGSLSASTDARIALGGETPEITASNVQAKLDELRLRRSGAKSDFLAVKSLAVTGGEFDLGKRSVRLAEIALNGGRIEADRDRDGRLSLEQLVKAPQEAAGKVVPGKRAADAEQSPWTARIERVKVAGVQYAFEDRVPADPVRLSGELTEAVLSNLSTEKGSEADFSLKTRVGKKGAAALAGKLRAEPLRVGAKLDVSGIDLVALQPYFADRLNVSATSGFLAARGDMSLEMDRAGQLKAAFRGETGLDGLNAVDSIGGGEVLNWRSLKVTGIDAAYPPVRLAIRKMSLEEFFSRVIIYTDGTLNLQLIVKPQAVPDAAVTAAPAGPGATEPAQAAAPVAAKPAPAKAEAAQEQKAQAGSAPDYAVRIDEVAVSGGTVDFSDNFIKPSYSADLKQIAGRVAGLSSEPGTSADLELRGTVSGTAPLEIAGKLNPLARELTLDIKAGVKDFELSPLSAYSGKYAGYAIEKGKLSFDVNYRIENRKLQASNRLLLDQLTFGEKVESPTATQLPVLFAVSLLKNSRGEIDLNLPISGSLDDPEFSIGGIVVQAIVNLIGKIVTAPFALIGSLFGGGEELGFVEFDAGSHALPEKAEKKLDTLAKALVERPGLKLDISGRADSEADREGLKRVALERRVRAQKLTELAKQGESVEKPDQVRVLPEEYAKFLERAYRQEKFEKPKTAVGTTKGIPVEEMEKLMLANTTVDDEQLRELAQRRAQEAKDHLVKHGKVPAERVFIVAPKIVAAGEKADGSPSRVEFSLK